MTFVELKDFLRFQLRERGDLDNVGGTNFLDKIINLAYIQLTTKSRFWGLKRDFYFPELFTSSTVNTADAGKSVNSATDVLYVEEVFDNTNTRRLNWIPWSKYIGYPDRADTSSESKPTEWHRRGTPGTSDLWIHPTADAIYELEFYYRKVPAILTGTSTTVVGAEWDEPILQLAVIKAYQWLQMHEKASAMKKEWVEMVSGLMGIYDKEEKARRESMRPDPMLKRGYS